ncbi:phospholipase C, phosphocholine-specific [Undibacterium cyanobacteriorum]|uniref:phospholipase C n=1 Tax=Undibacterium cyanobacteriorum TaxID=3073561 RepID=A0ABY9RJX5_9BURK|nr:phospholipase C, phosphocholine-specific [Undibacterium sp. 20NA77.5]WMW81509.1 phospholipase C, phosphocholine-specific [Undibacterium sp. 20NA77.5]
MPTQRRDFLKQLAGATAFGVASSAGASLPSSIARALSIPATKGTGSLQDVKHVVIFMQENRSFDHYFGCLRGVRGFGDPRPSVLRNGKPVWFQPMDNGRYQLPFPLKGYGDLSEDRSQCQPADLPHNWKYSQKMWAHYDVWVKEKTSMSMGYLTRSDLPFYYALADAFTIGDAYHASVFGPTDPNRLFLFSGTNGVSVGRDGRHALSNVDDGNETGSMLRDKAGWKSPYTWTTYAERLSANKVSWKVYQEYDNFGDNALAYFPQFRNLNRNDPAQEERYQRARAYAGETTELDEKGLPRNTNTADAQALVDRFAADVRSGNLPSVSWIVAPTKFCEHPEKNPPGYGESLTARLLDVLTEDPQVWSQTVFILCYDEEGGFFDHVLPPVPPANRHDGYSSVSTAGEISKGEAFGLGARLPFIIASPWTRGGYVCSDVFDHTSIIQFLEQRFGVHEPNISAWRRTICGNLLSMFDFKQQDASRPQQLFITPHQYYIEQANLSCSAKKSTETPRLEQLVRTENTSDAPPRPARALAYAIEVNATFIQAQSGQYNDAAIQLNLKNQGQRGAALTVFAQNHNAGPWYYSLAPSDQCSDVWSLVDFGSTKYTLRVHGPNGFLRQFQGRISTKLTVQTRYQNQQLSIICTNLGESALSLHLQDLFYGHSPQHIVLEARSSITVAWPCKDSGNWYDVLVQVAEDKNYAWRCAGHIENGHDSISDPANGKIEAAKIISGS